jgi:hypothetical protein
MPFLPYLIQVCIANFYRATTTITSSKGHSAVRFRLCLRSNIQRIDLDVTPVSCAREKRNDDQGPANQSEVRHTPESAHF